VRWLAWVHPVLMTALLAMALLALREGIAIRRGRISGRRVDSRRHRRLGKLAVPLLVVGFGAGIASMAWVRSGEPLAESVHFRLALPALLGFCVGGWLGLRLERGAGPKVRQLHAWFAALGLLLGLATGAAGMAILP
jgi:uncharacterized membrane protein YfcA